jgi:uncharacterized protein (TIGR03437 family)
MARFPGHHTRLLLGVFTALPAVLAQSPSFTASAVVNAASYSQPLAIGGLVSIFGQNLSPSTLRATAMPIPSELGGVRVLVNGAPSPVLYVSPAQVNFQLPFRTATPDVTIQVVATNGRSAAVEVPVSRAAPALFTQAGGAARRRPSINAWTDRRQS